MNEQDLKQLYDRYNPGVPFEQFVQEMQDPEYRSQFLRSTMLQMGGQAKQVQEQVTTAARQMKEPPAPVALEEEQVFPDYTSGIEPPKDRPFVGARPAETPFLSSDQIQEKYPQAKQEVDFPTATSSPSILKAELNKLRSAPISEEPTPAVGIAKKVTDAENLYAKAFQEKADIIAYRYKQFIKSRQEEYAGAIQSEEDRKIIDETIKKEAALFIEIENEKLKAEVAPFYEAYAEIYNSDMNQMAMKNPTMANAYYRERAIPYSQMGTGERALRNALMLPMLSSAQSALADVMPGMWAAARASAATESYEDYVARKYKLDNRLNYGMARQRMAPGQQMQDQAAWESRIAKEAVQDEIGRVGEEQFKKDKEEYNKAQAARRAMDLEYAYEQQGEAAGKMSSFAPSWEETSGGLGISEYIQKNVGQALGFAAPTVAGAALSAVPGGATVGAPLMYAGTAAMMYGVEAGSSYTESIDALRERYPKLSTEEILRLNLDEPYRDAAVRTGIVNAALEQVSNLTMIGKFITKSSVIKLVDKLVTSRAGKITIGGVTEGVTEWVQKKDQRYQQYLADGLTNSQAIDKALAQDDIEEFIAGATGGAGVSTMASFFQTKKKAQADAVVNTVSTGNPDLDRAIDRQAKEAELANPPKGDLKKVPTQEEIAEVEAEGTPMAAPTTFAQGFQRTAKVEEGAPQAQPEQGSTATLPPRVKGGQDRNFVFDNGAWKQQVGGDLLEIPGIQQEVNSAFTAQTGQPMAKPEPVEAVTPAAQSKFQKGQELFVVKDGQIMPVTYQSLSTSGKNASVQMSNGNRISVNPKDLFETEQAALDFMEAPPVEQPQVTAEQPQVTPQVTAEEQTQEDPLVIESEKELEELFGPPVTTTAPEQQTTPEVTPEKKEAYTVDRNGNVVKVSIVESNDGSSTILFEDGTRSQRLNRELFDSEQKAKDYVSQTAEEEVTPGQAPLEPLTKAEENKIKRYFWNKNPKSFADLGTALSMTRDEWKGVARRLYKSATPEEKAMLEKLVGADTFTTPATETTTEQVQQENERVVTPLVDDQALLDNGYTAEQIKMIYDNPQTFGQIDNNIVNLETEELVKPAGKKKTTRPPRRRPKPAKKTYPKRTPEDLREAIKTNGKSIQDVLEIIAGIPDSPYADMAVQLLEILPKSKMALKTTFRNTDHPYYSKSRNTAGGFYSSHNQIWINLAGIKKYVKELEKRKFNISNIAGLPSSLKNIKREEDGTIQKITIHEIIHAFTVNQLHSAIPVTRTTLAPSIRALNAYLNNGKDQNIKDLIKLYLAARDQFSALKKRIKEGDKTVDERTTRIYNRNSSPYGLSNIQEFLSEAFSNSDFQRLLDTFKSPLTERKSQWQSFLDAVKRILKISDYERTKDGAVTGEYTRPASGSILEDVLTVTPDMMQSGMENTFRPRGGPEIANASVFPTDSKVVSAVTKMAQGLINSGKATKENVIDKLKERIADKFDIDVDAISEEVLAGVTEKPGRTTAPVTGKTDTQTLLDEFNQDVNRRSMGIGQESKAFARGAKAEKVADFLRDKITDREELDAFVDAWNQSLTPLPDTGKVNPDAYLKAADANRAWELIKPAKQPKAQKVATVAEVLQAQWDARAKGIAQGVRQTTQKFRDNLLKAVQDAIKETPSLSKTQVSQMIGAVKRVNFFTAGSISKLKARIEALQNNAELAAKEARARQLQKSLKSLSKRDAKTALPIYKEAAMDFLRIDTDYLKPTEDGKDPLDVYIAEGSALEAAFASGKKYKPANVDNLSEYVEAQIDYKREKQLEELDFGNAEDLKNAIDGVSLENLNSILKGLREEEKRQMLLERAMELKEELQNNTDKEVQDLRNANLTDLNLDQLMMYIRVADNVILNEDNSSLGLFSSVLKEKESMKSLQQNRPARAFEVSSELVSYLGQQLGQLIDSIYRAKDYSFRFFYPDSGLSEYVDGGAISEKESNEASVKIEEKIDSIDQKYAGVFLGKRKQKELRSRSENAKLLMLSELGKYVFDGAEHIEKVHNNIQRSIDLLIYGRDPEAKEATSEIGLDVEFGQELQKIYDKYKNVKTAEEAIEMFKKNDPHVHELWSYISTEVYTPEFQKRLSDNTRSVHGKVFIPFTNYMPTAWKSTGIDTLADPEANLGMPNLYKSVKPQPAQATKEARRTMTTGTVYDFDNYINRIANSYSESVRDINTSKHLMLFSNLVRNPKFDALVGGLKNAVAIVRHVAGVHKMENTIGVDNPGLVAFNAIAESAASLGSVSALGGLDQTMLQYPTAAVSTMIMLGSDANLLFAAPSYRSKLMDNSFYEGVQNILKKKGISIRGQQYKLDLNTRNYDFAERSGIVNAFAKLRKGNKAIQSVILKPLTHSDMSIAERAFIAFYLQGLKRAGVNVDMIDLSKESQLSDQIERKRALAYADAMVDDLMVSSTSAGRSRFAQERGLMAAGRKLLFPFVTFPMNVKMRIILAAKKTRSNPKEGAQELAAALGEAVAYNSLRVFVLPFYYAMWKSAIEGVMGLEGEDEEEKKNKIRNFTTSVALDMLPLPNFGVLNDAINPAINYANYKLSPTEARTLKEFMKDKKTEPLWEKKIDFSKYNSFSEFGQYGIGLDRMADMLYSVSNLNGDYVVINEGSDFEKIIEKKGDEYDQLLWLNVMNQWLPNFREIRTSGERIYKEQIKKVGKNPPDTQRGPIYF